MQVRLSGAKWFSCWVVQLLLVVRAYKNIATYHIWLQQTLPITFCSIKIRFRLV